MSSLITSALNLTVGLLWNKVRDHTANLLKERDLTDEKCRQLIVRELSDMKTKLDGLARKDLLSSVSFLEEGICLLNLSLDKSINDENKEDISAEAVASTATMLSKATSKLKIASDERFTSAKRSFEKSNTKATEAFSNEALSTEDRILATKLRVISRILESLEDPDAAAETCKLYLAKLHDLPAIREMLSVYLGGGMKSLFNKTKREENVMLIAKINLEVFGFTWKFCKEVNLLNWPMIQFGKETCHPLFLDSRRLIEILRSDSKVRLLQDRSGTFHTKREIHVNTKGEIIVVTVNYSELQKFPNVFKINTELAKKQSLYNHAEETSDEVETEIPTSFYIQSSTIDGEDNVYIVICYETTDGVYHNKLLVLDASGNVKYRSQLGFIKRNCLREVSAIVVSKDRKKIFIHAGKHVYVCDSSGQLKYNFPLKERFKKVFLAISDVNEVIAAASQRSSVYIYTEEGNLKRRFEISDSHSVSGMAFNYVTKEVIIKEEDKHCVYLSTYSKAGEQRQCFPIEHHEFITSHPSGQVALANYIPSQDHHEVLFLQKFR